jgi:holo-[acyl-carrier protein] synthase
LKAAVKQGTISSLSSIETRPGEDAGSGCGAAGRRRAEVGTAAGPRRRQSNAPEGRINILIFGIGTDIIEVARIEKQVSDDGSFRDRIFTPREIEYCEERRSKAMNYAARFAAKEAFFKAIGTGWRGGLGFRDVEIVNDELGRPSIVLHGKAKEFADEHELTNITVSLTHIKDMANAIVVIEK